MTVYCGLQQNYFFIILSAIKSSNHEIWPPHTVTQKKPCGPHVR